MNNQPVIAGEYRGGRLENTHQGIICVINDQREVIYEKGMIFTIPMAGKSVLIGFLLKVT